MRRGGMSPTAIRRALGLTNDEAVAAGIVAPAAPTAASEGGGDQEQEAETGAQASSEAGRRSEGVLAKGWPTMIPVVLLIYVLFSGFTPYYAAFTGITACIVIGFLNPHHRLGVRDLADAFYLGSKYALAVGAAVRVAAGSSRGR